jgi:hypothetical protein
MSLSITVSIQEIIVEDFIAECCLILMKWQPEGHEEWLTLFVRNYFFMIFILSQNLLET